MSPVNEYCTSLKLLNTLFSLCFHKEIFFGNEIESAINFILKKRDIESKNLSLSSHGLLQLYQGTRDLIGLIYWDFLEQNRDPLWLRSEFLKVLRVLKPYKRSVLLVANLNGNPQYLFAGKRRDSQEIREYLEGLVASQLEDGVQMNLLFID